jgi:hypothetical protein
MKGNYNQIRVAVQKLFGRLAVSLFGKGERLAKLLTKRP